MEQQYLSSNDVDSKLNVENILRTMLHDGLVEVVFTKKDQTERVMIATLNKDIVQPYQRKTNREAKARPVNLWPVFDTEVNQWRTLNIETIKRFERVQA